MSSPASDRNLLFGILALQMDFISRDQLIAAMNAWVLDKEQPLGDILVRQQALEASRQTLLEALVQEHLKQHGNDAQESLAAVSSIGSMRKELEGIADPDMTKSIARLSVAFEDKDACGMPTVSVGVSTSAGTRFRILRPHAKGGLGEVYVAHDEELHREVALKEIQSRFADNPASRARFLLEAEITGGLEHPGIVPVYGLGQYADGRPFYAMRFIRGDSLKDAIARFHKVKTPEVATSEVSGERVVQFRKLLSRFLDICNAIQYAHDRGVLHRDLKPGNIMLGKYGETLVVDWGLARVTGEGRGERNETEEEALRPSSASGSAETVAGSVLGTPQYMSPEQAEGQLDLLGPASDVYSLGATLYCILTGKAPFQDPDSGRILEKVTNGHFATPRQVNPAVSTALEAVCLKAMARRPKDRYPSPRDLADDIEHWLADEPVSAYREPLRVRAARWARRHRGVTAATVAAGLVALMFVGAGAWWLDRQRTSLRRAVEEDLDQVANLQQQAHWTEAAAALGQADARLGIGGPEDLRGRLSVMHRELDLIAGLDAIRLKKELWLGGKLDEAATDQSYAAVFATSGLASPGDDVQETADRVSASRIHAPLIVALDDWVSCATAVERKRWLLEVLQRADPSTWRDRARQAIAARDRPTLERLAAEEEAAGQPPHLVANLAGRLGNKKGKAAPLLERLQSQRPQDFWLNFILGNSLIRSDPREAVGYLRAALVLRPDTPAVRNNLGQALFESGRFEQAKVEFSKATRLDPDSAAYHFNLGNVLRDQGRSAEAYTEYRTAIALDARFAAPHANLGGVLEVMGRREEARGEYQEALQLDPTLAPPHNNLANLLHQDGRLEDAKIEYRKAFALDPTYALAHNGLGNVLYLQGQREEAKSEYRKAIELDPKFANPHHGLANVLFVEGRLEQALAEYRRSLSLGLDAASAQVQSCERLLPLQRRLPGLIAGKDQPANVAERVAFAELCQQSFERRYALAARLYGEAFRIDPRLAGNMQQGYRYNAACTAALAGRGQGMDKAELSDRDRAALRQQAREWLQADLTYWADEARSSKPADRALVQQTLRSWLQDDDLVGVRDRKELAKLPDEEAKLWQKLWTDVGGLLKGAQGR